MKTNSLSPTLPLTNTTVLVTRADRQSDNFVKLLQQYGTTALSMSCLCIAPPTNWELTDNALTNINEFDWLIFTSTNGIDYFCNRMINNQGNINALKNIKIAVVGSKTANHLINYGITPSFTPPDFVSDSLIECFPNKDNLKGTKILYPKLEAGGRENIPEELSSLGASVTAIPAYQSNCNNKIPSSIVSAFKEGKIDVVTFASPKTVECFYQMIQSIGGESFLNNICIASIGPVTSVVCKDVLGRVDVEAQPYTLNGLIKAIIKWNNYEKNHHK
ncbi:uroporphyrinogen-III synthase [Rivularia sp. UHCC 0363]|uniref:uroporphyrinogen-III synthase n=1 Tax=Rivularia sp. UHCC 0363 TaxID=3110244 RepID=UPI002B209C57|nr:uroporphyrinogen-III synthase [Rivularia sp. UHCC 0363]MEA5598722.1 uroporphyrinogen-III synthase [Rivularia sp. UHCC 0363]